MKKKLCLLLSSIMILSLIGCGKEYKQYQKDFISKVEDIIETLEKIEKDESMKIGEAFNKIHYIGKIIPDAKVLITEQTDEYKLEWETLHKLHGAFNDNDTERDQQKRAKIVREEIEDILEEYKDNAN